MFQARSSDGNSWTKNVGVRSLMRTEVLEQKHDALLVE